MKESTRTEGEKMGRERQREKASTRVYIIKEGEDMNEVLLFYFFCFFCFWVNFTFLELVKESVIFMVFLALFFYQKVKKIELFLILVENNFFILSRK